MDDAVSYIKDSVFITTIVQITNYLSNYLYNEIIYNWKGNWKAFIRPFKGNIFFYVLTCLYSSSTIRYLEPNIYFNLNFCPPSSLVGDHTNDNRLSIRAFVCASVTKLVTTITYSTLYVES